MLNNVEKARKVEFSGAPCLASPSRAPQRTGFAITPPEQDPAHNLHLLLVLSTKTSYEYICENTVKMGTYLL